MKLTIIGAGKMGEALARGILASGTVSPQNMVLTDVGAHLAALANELGVTAMDDNRQAVDKADLVMLAVKPQYIAGICAEIAPALAPTTLVVSIAAGVTLSQIASALARTEIVLARAMPNTPCLVSAGAFGLAFSAGAPGTARQAVHELLAPLGIVEEVPEYLMDVVTGLSGSGPAYVAIFIEALADGAVQMGLPRQQALRLATQTVLGTAQLLQQSGQHPAVLKDAVASPGGTTIAAIAALEETGFRHAAMAAVRAATRRSRELSGE